MNMNKDISVRAKLTIADMALFGMIPIETMSFYSNIAALFESKSVVSSKEINANCFMTRQNVCSIMRKLRKYGYIVNVQRGKWAIPDNPIKDGELRRIFDNGRDIA